MSECGYTENSGYKDINLVLSMCRSKIFDFEYPIFDEEYRPILETKILKHYYTREICAESVGLWKLFLQRRMQEIMPYYNQLYKSATLEFNPLYDVDITKTGNKTTEDEHSDTTEGITEVVKDVQDDVRNSGDVSHRIVNGGSDTDSGTVRNKNDHWDYYSDTPQGSVGNLENLTYLTNARHVTDDSNGSTSSSTTNYGKTVQDTRTDNTRMQRTLGDNTDTTERKHTLGHLNSTDEYLERIQGKNGGVSYSKLLQEYRETFLNIDMLIIRELRDLFFNLW